MENTFRPSRFLSLHATTPSPCTWEEIMQELTGERHAAVTALFRALAAGRGQNAETSNGSKADQAEPTRLRPFRPPGGRTLLEAHQRLSGSIMVDIDGIPEDIFDETSNG